MLNTLVLRFAAEHEIKDNFMSCKTYDGFYEIFQEIYNTLPI